MKVSVWRHAADIKSRRMGILLAVCLVLAMTFMMAACGGSAESPETGTAAAEEPAGGVDGQAVGESAETDSKDEALPGKGDEPAGASLPGSTAENPQAGIAKAETAEARGGEPAADGVASAITLSIRDGQGQYMLEASEISPEEGDTALDVLVRAGRVSGIPVVYSGTKKSAYVEGIGNLFEFDEGPESGWMYRVNGEKPLVGCGAAALEPGDRVEWIYVTSLEEGFE